MCGRYYLKKSVELEPFVDKVKNSALGKKMIVTLGKPLNELRFKSIREVK